MHKNQFDDNVTNDVAINVANEVPPVIKWMEVYPNHFNQSKTLLHKEIKWLKNNITSPEINYTENYFPDYCRQHQ